VGLFLLTISIMIICLLIDIYRINLRLINYDYKKEREKNELERY